jgi:hypothetical protein
MPDEQSVRRLFSPPNVHLSFTAVPVRADMPKRVGETRCIICCQLGGEFPCERCGRLLHGDCVWKEGGIASAEERARFWDEDYDDREGRDFPFLCRGCRS